MFDMQSLLGSSLGQSLIGRAGGPAASYMQRPASNTNLPRTIGRNVIARATTPAYTMEYTGMSNGNQPFQPAMTHPAFGNNPAFNPNAGNHPTYSVTQNKPPLERFVPGTTPGGGNLLTGANGGGQQGARPSLFGALGGGAIGGQGQAPIGDYRTILAQLFPPLRGEGFANNIVSDYFQGPVQPSFAQKFSYLA